MKNISSISYLWLSLNLCTGCLDLNERPLETNNLDQDHLDQVALDQSIDFNPNTVGQCGDSIIQENEECDDGNDNNEDECTNQCSNARCGDGITYWGEEECDDGNQNNNEACTNTCMAIYIEDICDGLDNDQDSLIDEAHFPLPTRLDILFSPLTGLGELGRIEITDGEGQPIEGSPFTTDELTDQWISVNDSRFAIRIIIEDMGDRTKGYEIIQITDQDNQLIFDEMIYITDQDGNTTIGGYPTVSLNEDGLVPVPLDQFYRVQISDSQGGGIECQDPDVQACQLGRLTCQLGQMLCNGDEYPTDEICE